MWLSWRKEYYLVYRSASLLPARSLYRAMENGGKVLFIVQSILGMSLAGIIAETSMPEEYSVELAATTAKIIKNCHGSWRLVVGIAGDTPDILISSLFNENLAVKQSSLTVRPSSPVLVLRYSSSKGYEPPPIETVRFFALAAITPSKFNSTLDMIRQTSFWNHLAHYYIIDGTKDNFGCEKKALELLLIAWKFDILEAKFLCHDDPAKPPLIFTFNPYTNEFPPPWTMTSIHRVDFNNPWTLLSRRAQKNGDLCRNLNFDKTKNLAGYPIRMSHFHTLPNNPSNMSYLYDKEENVLREIFPVLNSTEIFSKPITQFDRLKIEGIRWENLYPDILASEYILSGEVLYTYPHRQEGIYILTQRGREETQLAKIAALIDHTSQIFYVCVFILTLIFFKFFSSQTLAGAALSTLKVFLGSSLTRVPKDFTSRIYLTSLFMFIVTLLGIYMGKFSSLLSIPVFLSDIDSLEDLTDSDHMIYCHDDFSSYLSRSEFNNRIVIDDPIPDDSYGPWVPKICSKKSRIAYLDTWTRIMDIIMHMTVMQCNLYISKNPVASYSLVWSIRHNWPLEAKINLMIQRLVEGGIIKSKFVKRIEAQGLQTWSNQKNALFDDGPKILNLEDLKFAFVMLGVGLTLATMGFIAEFIWGFMYDKMRNKVAEQGR